jgi:hypothetical protein
MNCLPQRRTELPPERIKALSMILIDPSRESFRRRPIFFIYRVKTYAILCRSISRPTDIGFCACDIVDAGWLIAASPSGGDLAFSNGHAKRRA